jgi:hypothetical protein
MTNGCVTSQRTCGGAHIQRKVCHHHPERPAAPLATHCRWLPVCLPGTLASAILLRLYSLHSWRAAWSKLPALHAPVSIVARQWLAIGSAQLTSAITYGVCVTAQHGLFGLLIVASAQLPRCLLSADGLEYSR